MAYETVKDWELRNGVDYPKWGSVWAYDAYGERWEDATWYQRKSYYEDEREQPEGTAPWEFQFEPVVAVPPQECPKWGQKGIPPLKRS